MLAIIIPSYENGDQLREALDSLHAQTFHRFLTIVVDDASPSDSIKSVVEEYRSKMSGLLYVRADVNGGPGAARQRGIEAAHRMNCDYIMFMDQDDRLFPMSVKLLLDTIQISQTDMVSSCIHLEGKLNEYNVISADNQIWLHGKIFSLPFLIKNDIYFESGIRLNEDVFFFKKISLLPSDQVKSGSIDCATYLWRNNTDSLTRADHGDLFTRESMMDYIKGINLTIEWCVRHNYDYTPISQMMLSLYKYEEHLKIIAPECLDEASELIDKICSYPEFQAAYANAIPNCLYFVERCPRYLKYQNKYYEFAETPLQWARRHQLKFAIFKKM